MATDTKQRLLDSGMAMLLQRGYNDLGIQALLEQTSVPKGSFYHHFKSKEDFALEIIDQYMAEVHEGLDACLHNTGLDPLQRVRRFFELSREKYREEGYFGCLLGGVGQELSGVNERFRERIEGCFSYIARRIADSFAEARLQGYLAPDVDPREKADLLLNCWEGAALRSRLRRDPGALNEVLDFYFDAIANGC